MLKRTRSRSTGKLMTILLSALFIASLAACGGDDDTSGDEEDVSEAATKTIPVEMEIVTPEPGEMVDEGDDLAEPVEGDNAGEGEDDSEGEPVAEEPAEQAEEPAAADGTYVIQAGDSMYQIAVEFGVDIDELLEINSIENPEAIQPGQELIIP